MRDKRAMRPLALVLLLIGSLATQRALAENAPIQPPTRAHCVGVGMMWDENVNVCVVTRNTLSEQPLTRVDCGNEGMTWDENANICESESHLVETMPRSNQPLTRSECNLAGMAWNENANVCEEAGTGASASALLITIDKATQRMTVSLDGVERYGWPVSTGQPGYSTPSGTYTASSMNEIWYSKQWDDAPMPHAIFFTKKGHAVHGTNETKKLGKPASHGCVRLAPENARTLFALVKEKGLENTDIVLGGDTPGGESRVASPGRKQQIKPRSRIEEPRRFGRRWWFRRYYSGPRRWAPEGFYMGRPSGPRGWRD